MGVSLKKKMETEIFCNFFQAGYLPIFLLAKSLKFKTDFFNSVKPSFRNFKTNGTALKGDYLMNPNLKKI